MESIFNLTSLKTNSATVGGKAASLGELISGGFDVPPGFVVASKVFDNFLDHHKIKTHILDALQKVSIDDNKSVNEVSKKIRGLVESKGLPSFIEKELIGEFRRLDTKYVAVRSSATVEDGIHDAWSGQLETYLNTTEDSLFSNVKKCWSSLFTPRAIVYRHEKKVIDKYISVGVIVQSMIESDVSGVAFSVNPVTNDKNEIIVEAGLGLGEAVVGGHVIPDNYSLSKNPIDILTKNISTQKKKMIRGSDGGWRWVEINETEQKMSDSKIIELAGITNRIEQHFDFPVDVEWALKDGKFFITQSRPITTLDKKEDKEMTKLYKAQISLTEWYESIGHADTSDLREEDNFKRDRMGIIDEVIGFPYDKPTTFSALDIVGGSEKFIDFLERRGRELCALRLIPLERDLPKLRMRGHSVENVVEGWFVEQEIDPSKYRADFVPHPSDHLWSTIFVVNKYGIFGEIIEGGHQQLTQGFYRSGEPITFSYNFSDWELSPNSAEAEEELKKIVEKLLVQDAGKQSQLKERLGAEFFHGYLCGYFETVTSGDYGVWFIDYNRLLGQQFSDIKIKPINEQGYISGQTGSPGKVIGKVRIMGYDSLEGVSIGKDEILVCKMTTPEYLPLMRKTKGIVTDFGGVLSHAAIVSRELRIPCVVGTKNATSKLKNGDKIEVNADRGLVNILP